MLSSLFARISRSKLNRERGKEKRQKKRERKREREREREKQRNERERETGMPIAAQSKKTNMENERIG